MKYEYQVSIAESLARISVDLSAIASVLIEKFNSPSSQFLNNDAAVEASGEDLDVDLDETVVAAVKEAEVKAKPKAKAKAKVKAKPEPKPEPEPKLETQACPLTKDEINQFNLWLVAQMERINYAGLNGEGLIRNVLTAHNLRGLSEIKDRSTLEFIQREVEAI